MKIYTNEIDLTKPVLKKFYTAPCSDYKFGVKIVQGLDYVIELNGVELESDGETGGFTTYKMTSPKEQGIELFKIQCSNGQIAFIKHITTDSTVFEVDEGGSAPIGGVVTKVNGESPIDGNVDVDKLKITDGFITGDSLIETIDTIDEELNKRIDLIEATSHPNMNVIGSPTFSEGSVGGFSANDYLMFPTSVNVGQNNVVFHMTITTGDNVSIQENILDSWCGLALAIQNGHFVLAASSNGTTFNSATGSSTVLANTSYNIKITFSYEEGEYKVELIVNDAVDASITMDAPLFATATYWGGANPSSGVNHIFGGTINLNECWMSWNGEVIWRGYSELPIPTKVSQLENDVGYATQTYVDNAIGQVLTQEEF